MEPEHIYHLAERSAWDAARQTGAYRESTRGRSLDDEGFIHCARGHQWPAVRRRFYADHPDDLVLLTIDPARLVAAVVDEVGDPTTGETFPHVYGPIEVSAVVGTQTLAPPHR